MAKNSFEVEVTFNNALDKCRVHHFADDTNLLFGSKCPSEISCVMNNELKLLTDWLRANKLSLNESKTKLLIFRPHRNLNITVPNIKACFRYLLSNFYYSPNDSLSKTMKNVFYFMYKALFVFEIFKL